MARQTTVKPISLHYRPVGSGNTYTPLMGVLKGLAVGQDEPDSTEIEAEFYDAPFDILYEGNPVTMTFELTNYDLDELPNLFGGTYDELLEDSDYESATNAYTSEWEWRLGFGRGYASLVIPRGLTIGTIKKDADGALNFSVTITSLVYKKDGKESLYRIKANSYHYVVVSHSTISEMGGNPMYLQLYELAEGETGKMEYVRTDDEQVVSGKSYFKQHSDLLADSVDSSEDSSGSSD